MSSLLLVMAAGVVAWPVSALPCGGVQEAGAADAAPTAQEPTPSSANDTWRDLVALTCLDCHGAQRTEGGVDLASALAAPTEHTALWTRALDQVRDGVMPPESPLSPAERAEWRDGLLAVLGVDTEDPGRPTLRRLTRSMLELALADLLGVTLELERFLPEDPAGYGFDTTGDTLFVTPLSFELWFEAVEAALDVVRGDPALVARLVPEVFERAATRAHLSAFLSRAFRRPAEDVELDTRVALVRAELTAGRAPRDAYLTALQSVLLAPAFLYRVEVQPPAGSSATALGDHELAARLSFFLWGRAPDAPLTALADKGGLRSALESEVLRMLADPRASWLATDFAAQWLGFAELAQVTPDVRRFSAFNEGLRRSMRAESEAFFADLVRADRSVLECLDSDHAFLDKRLAAHYGIEGVDHDDVRRVPITDRRRGGVLGMGAVLTITSQPLRTSPVARGQWMLERLFGAPPPPPPPNVGALPEDDRAEDGLSARARLARHTADPSCASCHRRLDPYGLALESYDGIGRWREATAEEALDTTVELPDGRAVDGAVALKELLRSEPERFVHGLTEHLFVYAIGRPPELADLPGLDRVAAEAASEGYRLSALIRGIVGLPAFDSVGDNEPTSPR